MKKKIRCWEVFKCDKKECPVYESSALNCWLIPGTHCRNEIQGKFLEKIEMCLECEPFKANMAVDSMGDTLKVVNEQLKEFRRMVDERDRELEGTSMELALGLSEVFEGLKELSQGNPGVSIPETSTLELIEKLKHMVNLTAENLTEIVELSHEFAIGLAEHFDALDRVSKGDLTARVLGTSKVALLESLKNVTNHMIESVSREIAERKQAEEQSLRQSALMEAINRIFRESLTCDTEEEVAQACLAVAEELTGSRFGFIGELNQQARLDTTAISNPGWDACKMPQSDSTILIKDMEVRGIWGTVLKGERSLIVNNPASHPDRVGIPEGHPALTSFMGVPFKRLDKTIGMIALANKERGFDLSDQHAVEALSTAFIEATSRKRAEVTLRHSEERFIDIADSMADWIWQVDENGAYTYCS